MLVYLDDILVHRQDVQGPCHTPQGDIEILRAWRFFCRLHKCHSNDTQMKYFGHCISINKVRLDLEKVEKVKEWLRPTTMQKV